MPRLVDARLSFVGPYLAAPGVARERCKLGTVDPFERLEGEPRRIVPGIPLPAMARLRAKMKPIAVMAHSLTNNGFMPWFPRSHAIRRAQTASNPKAEFPGACRTEFSNYRQSWVTWSNQATVFRKVVYPFLVTAPSSRSEILRQADRDRCRTWSRHSRTCAFAAETSPWSRG